MTDPFFRILLIASALVLILAAIDFLQQARTRHQTADPGPSAGPSAAPRRH